VADAVIDIQGFEVIPDAALSGSVDCLSCTKINTNTYEFEVYFKGLRGVIDVAASATVNFLKVSGADVCVVNGADLTINANDSATSVEAIAIFGQSTARAEKPEVQNCKINFYSPVGTGIRIGRSGSNSYVDDYLVAGNHVVGKYYALATPHAYILSDQVTQGECKGNIAQDIFVGYLISETTDSTIQGNVAFDCYGPSYYVKGATDCTIRDNIAVCTGKFTQRTNGILSVGPQGATNTSAATIQENLVIVQDMSKVHALADIVDSSQTCSYIRNTYIVPDTVNVASDQLFNFQNGLGGAANYTLAQWNAETSYVTDDVVITLPESEISALISTLRPSVKNELFIDGLLLGPGKVNAIVDGNTIINI